MAKQQNTSFQELNHAAWGNSRTVDHVDSHTIEAVNAYVSKVREALKTMDVPPLLEILLYGSRARGDHTVESDADLALVFEGREVSRSLEILEELSETTHQIEATFAFMVSPTIIWSELLDSPVLSSNPGFYRTILAEGIPWSIE